MTEKTDQEYKDDYYEALKNHECLVCRNYEQCKLESVTSCGDGNFKPVGWGEWVNRLTDE